MQGKERTFTPQVEKVWNIDGEDNIVERCTRTYSSYDAALDEAEKKMGILQRPYGIYTQLCRYQIIRSICKNVVSGGRHEYI